MKISKKTMYGGIAIAVVLVAIGVYIWYTSQREGFVNLNIGDVIGKAQGLSGDPDMVELKQANPGPRSAYFDDLRYHFPWFVIGSNEPAGKIKLSRVKAYLEGQVDLFPIFTAANSAVFMNNPVFAMNCPFGGIGNLLKNTTNGNIILQNWNNPAVANLKLVFAVIAAIAVHNHASLLTKGVYDRKDYEPVATADPGWQANIPKYTQQEKDLMLKLAPKILDIDDDTDPKVAFTVALTDAKSKNCATGSYQGQIPSYAYVGGGVCTNNDKLLALRNKLKPEEYQAIIVQVFALGPPPPPPPAPIAPTIPVPTPAAPAAAPPPVDDKSGGPVPVASSSGAYAASCTRCTLLNNQLSCSCDVTAR